MIASKLTCRFGPDNALTMRIAYVFDLNNNITFAGKTVAEGFQHAFLDLKHTFRFFDSRRLDRSTLYKSAFIIFNPDLIFCSVEDLKSIPLNILKNKKLVLWGQFYERVHFEEQVVQIAKDTKRLLSKFRDRHDILIWSQHDEEINNRFFSGYTHELGLKFIQLLHAADTRYQRDPNFDWDFDFFWAGNVAHRADTYQKWIEPLKKIFTNYRIHTEHNQISPKDIMQKKYYARSFMSPNIHTEAQIQHRILVNERLFTSSLSGAFQICDNILARKYFSEDQLVICKNGEDILGYAQYFAKHADKRLKMIQSMAETIKTEHTYHHRIKQIFAAFEMPL